MLSIRQQLHLPSENDIPKSADLPIKSVGGFSKVKCPTFEEFAKKHGIEIEEPKKCGCKRKKCITLEEHWKRIYPTESKPKGGSNMNTEKMNLYYYPGTGKIIASTDNPDKRITLIISKDTKIMCPTIPQSSPVTQCFQIHNSKTVGKMIMELGQESSDCFELLALVSLSSIHEDSCAEAASIQFLTNKCPFKQYCWDHGLKEPLQACTPTAE